MTGRCRPFGMRVVRHAGLQPFSRTVLPSAPLSCSPSSTCSTGASIRTQSEYPSVKCAASNPMSCSVATVSDDLQPLAQWKMNLRSSPKIGVKYGLPGSIQNSTMPRGAWKLPGIHPPRWRSRMSRMLPNDHFGVVVNRQERFCIDFLEPGARVSDHLRNSLLEASSLLSPDGQEMGLTYVWWLETGAPQMAATVSTGGYRRPAGSRPSPLPIAWMECT